MGTTVDADAAHVVHCRGFLCATHERRNRVFVSFGATGDGRRGARRRGATRRPWSNPAVVVHDGFDARVVAIGADAGARASVDVAAASTDGLKLGAPTARAREIKSATSPAPRRHLSSALVQQRAFGARRRDGQAHHERAR